jgi:hypothetical protein
MLAVRGNVIGHCECAYLFHSLHRQPIEFEEASGLDLADHVAGMDQCTAKRQLEANRDQIYL